MAPEVVGASIATLSEGVRQRRWKAREVVEAYLDRVGRVDRALGCYLRVDADGARQRADAVDARVAQGQDPGLLAGVPIALKDIFVTRGLETTCGSKILRGFVPPYESTAGARLAAAGAVNLGKLNMDEFAMGSSNENSAFGPVRNPWDTSRVPGGSSGGSAAAVAASLCAGSLGTDTGGSIRQPASLCGIVGVKPTYGLVSRYGVIAFASSLDHPGPFGRTVEDAAALLEVIAGHDPLDATSIPQPAGRYREACGAGLAGLRVGVPSEYFQAGIDPEVEAAVRAALDALARAGAKLVPISLPHTKYAIRDLLPDLHRRGVVEPGALRRRALRAPHRRGGQPGGHVHAHARRGLRPRAQAAHHARHVRAARRLLRGVLRQGAARAAQDRRRLPRGVRPGRRHRHADVADRGVQAGRARAGPAADVPGRHLHRRARPGRHPGAQPVLRLHRDGAAHRAADRRAGAGRGDGVPRGGRVPEADRLAPAAPEVKA